MGGVDNPRTFRDFVEFVDEDGAFFRQVVHNIAVMNDLLADVDGCAEGIERDLDDVDSANDPGAEAARLEEKYPLGFRLAAGFDVGYVLKGGCGHVSSIPRPSRRKHRFLNQIRCGLVEEKDSLRPEKWSRFRPARIG